MSESKTTVFTCDEVVALDRYQRAHEMHPFTCPNRGDGGHRDNGIDLGGLIPTVRGWICQFCDYTQDWAHDFMKANKAMTDNKTVSRLRAAEDGEGER